MKVLYLHNDYAKPSGEESASNSLAEMLREHGHEVEFLKRSSAEITGVGGKIKAFFTGLWNPCTEKTVAAKLDQFQPDIVFVQNLFPFLSPSVFRPVKARNLPVVMRTPNYRLFCPIGLCYRDGKVCEECFDGHELRCFRHQCKGGRLQSLGYALRGWFSNRFRLIRPNVDMFITQSEFQKQKFIDRGIPADHIGIVPGIMPKIACAGWEPGKYVTFVGRVSPEKGVDEFIEAARRLPDIPFMVAGDYSAMPELKAASPANVVWRGFLKGDDLRQAYLDSAMIVVPSKWYEGFPNVIVMAMMLSRPVVAADIGATGSIIADGVTGRHFIPGNPESLTAAVAELYRNPELRRQLGETGFKTAEKLYSREAIYRCLNGVIEAAVKNNSRCGRR